MNFYQGHRTLEKLNDFFTSMLSDHTSIHSPKKVPSPRPFPYILGKILTFDRKVVDTFNFYQNERI